MMAQASKARGVAAIQRFEDAYTELEDTLKPAEKALREQGDHASANSIFQLLTIHHAYRRHRGDFQAAQPQGDADGSE